MMGIDPIKAAQVKELLSNAKATIRIDHAANSFSVTLTSKDPKASEQLPQLIEQLVGGIGMQLNAFFGISGEIIDLNKKA